MKDRLFFYGSYYRPENTRNNRANLYGELPEYESTRNEGFGKLTFTPTRSILLNVSYRDSKRVDTSDLLRRRTPPASTGSGSEARLKIGTVDGSWVINNRSFATVKYTDFANQHAGPAGQHRQRHHQHHARARGSTSRNLDTLGPADRAAADRRADRVQRLHRSRSSTATATR